MYPRQATKNTDGESNWINAKACENLCNHESLTQIVQKAGRYQRNKLQPFLKHCVPCIPW